jgi:two-component system phosphate regulon response regulator PhoB
MADPATAGTLSGRTIVVADDEPHLSTIIAFNLRKAGADVTTVKNGAEALTLIRQRTAAGRRPDVLVTDFQMPVMSGYDLCKALRDDPATADMAALMLTARGHKLSPDDLAATVVRRVMGKPFSAADLIAQLRDLLSATPPAAAAA